MSKTEDELKSQVNQLVFDIRAQVQKKAYWNATKTAHNLYELLNSQPYVESNNEPKNV